MTEKLFSVIIPNWNGKHFLQICLDALAAQTYEPIEVIIVDNMSATVTGNYKLEGSDKLIFELTASDIMNDSIQPISKTTVTAKMIKFTHDELQLRFADDNETEDYKRVR